MWVQFIAEMCLFALCFALMVIGSKAIIAKSEDIEWSFFKYVKPGRFGFLYEFSKNYSVRKQGIIAPFFLVQTIDYFLGTALATLSIFFVIFENNHAVIISGGICTGCAFVLTVVIYSYAIIKTKILLKKLNKKINDKKDNQKK